MDHREMQWEKMKREYKERHMSEEGVRKMKDSIERAKAEKRRERRGIVLKRSLAGAAAAFLMVTVLPNTSPRVAHAMSRIPILSKWVEVVTFRDYRYESDRHMADVNVPEIVPQDVGGAADGGTQADVSDVSPENDSGTVRENIQKTAEEINAEIQEITEKLIGEFEENLKYEEGYQDLLVKSEVLTTTDKYFALKLICYQGAGSGAEWDYFYTIDLESGDRLALSDLFAEGSDYIGAISENIKEQMRAQMEADETVMYWLEYDIEEWNFDRITDETGFYLNQEGEVVICFNEGDVAPMYMGCVEFVIPGEAVDNIRIDSL